MHFNNQPALKMNHYGNCQIVLNDWATVRVTAGKGGVCGMTESEWYEHLTYFSGISFEDTPSCSTKPYLSSHNKRDKRSYRL